MTDRQLSFDDRVGDDPEGYRPSRYGGVAVTYRPTTNALTRASGFMSGYDFTLNPYIGCSFGCSYCYAAAFASEIELRDLWGEWVTVKENVVEKLRRMRTNLTGRTIYMSSVTDPYQQIEAKLGLVRDILEVLVPKQPRLVVQTRSPLVVRDTDLLLGLEHVRVNMTVTTDSESVRKAFEPRCPSNSRRLEAIREVRAAGVPASITLTPLLPVDDVDRFAEMLLETGVDDFVVQPFHPDRGRFVAGTREGALELIRGRNWTEARYRDVVDRLRERLPNLAEGQEGFRPA
jgi:DNA repair photolyase